MSPNGTRGLKARQFPTGLKVRQFPTGLKVRRFLTGLRGVGPLITLTSLIAWNSRDLSRMPRG